MQYLVMSVTYVVLAIQQRVLSFTYVLLAIQQQGGRGRRWGPNATLRPKALGWVRLVSFKANTSQGPCVRPGRLRAMCCVLCVLHLWYGGAMGAYVLCCVYCVHVVSESVNQLSLRLMLCVIRVL